MIINRVWAMPNKWTFKIKPINGLIEKYLLRHKVWIDPFCGESKILSIKNDIKYPSGVLAIKFLQSFEVMDCGILFDPPYSLEQCRRAYNSHGLPFTKKNSQNCVRWTDERDVIGKRHCSRGIVISFGWSSTCMGKKRGYKILEILMVSHGSATPDTLCVVEEKL